MERILQILRRFGGANLLDALPSKTDFEERLQKSAAIVNNLDSRLRAIDVEMPVIIKQEVKGEFDHKHY